MRLEKSTQIDSLHYLFLYIVVIITNKKWSYSVVVSTPDFESGILGSNPGKTSYISINRHLKCKKVLS